MFSGALCACSGRIAGYVWPLCLCSLRTTTGGSLRGLRNNIEARKSAESHLNDNGLVVIFPSGQIATKNKISKKIKILCTIGPSSLTPVIIRKLSEEEVDMFRINLSHTSLESLEKYIKIIKSSSNIPICLDSQGAQVRTGFIGEQKLFLNTGSIVDLVSNSEFSDDKHIPIYPDEALIQLRVGSLISLDFDTALLQVIETNVNIRARVISGGFIGSNKAVTIINNRSTMWIIKIFSIYSLLHSKQLVYRLLCIKGWVGGTIRIISTYKVF